MWVLYKMIYITRQDYETNEILRRIKVARKMLNVDTNRKSNWTGQTTVCECVYCQCIKNIDVWKYIMWKENV